MKNLLAATLIITLCGLAGFGAQKPQTSTAKPATSNKPAQMVLDPVLMQKALDGMAEENLQKSLRTPQKLPGVRPAYNMPSCGNTYPIGQCMYTWQWAWISICHNFHGSHMVTWCGNASDCPCPWY